jgi:teichuronic acid exporter
MLRSGPSPRLAPGHARVSATRDHRRRKSPRCRPWAKLAALMGRRTSTLSAVFWSGADAVLRQAASLASTMILARLLRPDDFGAVATLQFFVNVAGVFVSGGLGASLIRSPDSTRNEESAIFYFNLSVAAALAVLLALAAPAIAHFFADPSLQGLTYAMALNLFLTAFGMIHTTLLERALDFRTMAKVGFVASVLSSALAITLAYYNFGAWSLAAQGIASTAISSLLLWQLHPWRPVLHWDLRALRKHFRFGGYLLVNGLLDSATNHLNTVLIAKLYSVRDLGFYSRAEGTRQLPTNLMTGVLNRVALPIFAAAAKEPTRLLAGMRRAQSTVMWLNVPLTLGLIVVAEPLVLTLFGDAWAPAVPILQVLSLVGMIWPLHVFNLNVLLAQGHSDLFFRINVIKKVANTVLVVAASFFGVLAMAWAQVLASCFAFIVNAYYTGRFLNYGATQQLRDLTIYWLLAVPMAGLLWLVRPWLGSVAAIQLTALTCLGAAFYLAASWRLRLPAFQELLALLNRHRRPPQPDPA